MGRLVWLPRFSGGATVSGLRLPKKLADDLHVATGTEVDIQVKDGKLVLTPVKRTRTQLKDLLAGVTDDNLHDEVDFGSRRGREAW